MTEYRFELSFYGFSSTTVESFNCLVRVVDEEESEGFEDPLVSVLESYVF